MTHHSIIDARKAVHATQDTLGCSLGQLAHDASLRTADLVVMRKGACGRVRTQVHSPAQDRGMVVGLSLMPGHHRHIRQGGRRFQRQFDRDGIYIRDFEVDYCADLCGAFDFVVIELPRHLRLRAVDDDARDPVLGGMARAMLGWMADPLPMQADQAGLALLDHLTRRYACAPRARRVTALSPRELALAKEMLLSDHVERLHLDHVAAALSLPRARLFREFRRMVGQSPLQWLIQQRIDHAQRLLRGTDLPLAEIALTCGFADQSHFTRMFQRSQGVSPGRWRRGPG